MIYSERTYEPDAQATVSALKDVIQRQLNAEQLQLHMELIGRANDCSVAARPATCCERRCKSTKLIPLSRPTTQRIPRTCLQGTACGGCQMPFPGRPAKPRMPSASSRLSKLAGQVLNPA